MRKERGDVDRWFSDDALRSRRTAPFKRTPPKPRQTPVRATNPKRRKKKFEKQYGDKSRWMRDEYPRCLVSNRTDFVQHAHTRGHAGMGGCNSDNKALAPLFWKVHIHFDHLTDERFEAAYPGWTKDLIREKADEIEAHWQEVNAT